MIIFHTDYPVFFSLCVFTLRAPAFVSRQKLNEKQENYLVWPNTRKDAVGCAYDLEVWEAEIGSDPAWSTFNDIL